MIVGGNNCYCQLCEKSNYTLMNGEKAIFPPIKSPLDTTTLLSYSFLYNSIWVNQIGKAYALGNNTDLKINGTLPPKILLKNTEIKLQDKNAKFESAVCGHHYTLYQVSNKGKSYLFLSSEKIKGKNPCCLNISSHEIIGLFGGEEIAVAIDSKGNMIIIDDKVFSSPSDPIISLSLPSGDKAVQVSCCDHFMVVLGLSGKVYMSDLPDEKVQSYEFVEVPELSNLKIVEVSGSFGRCFAICEDGRVFGYKKRDIFTLGVDDKICSLKKFKVIKSLMIHKVVHASAGMDHSIFTTSDGKVLTCGANIWAQLMINKPQSEGKTYPSITHVSSNASFCIAGFGGSVVFEGELPKNMPNMSIKNKLLQIEMTNSNSLIASSKSLFQKPISSSIRSSEKRAPSDLLIKPSINHSHSSSRSSFDLLSKSSLNSSRSEKDTTASPLKKADFIHPAKSSSLQNEELINHKLEIENIRKENEMLRKKDDESKIRIENLESELVKTKEELEKQKKLAKKNEELEKQKNLTKKNEECDGNALEFKILNPSYIDKLAIIKTIGCDSKTKIYEVANDHFILKVLNLDMIKKPSSNETDEFRRFIRDYEVLNSLNHPNIIKAFGICFGDEKHEFCQYNHQFYLSFVNTT